MAQARSSGQNSLTQDSSKKANVTAKAFSLAKTTPTKANGSMV